MALEKITEVVGRGVYVPGDDVDTDRIIPARYLKCITFDGLGDFAFNDERFNEDGSEKPHPLNDPRFKGASILLTGSNFGCGSSREHAPQSLYRYGFRAIIGRSFAEIFYGNSIKLGMPCLTAPREEIGKLAAAIEGNPGLEITVDVAAATVSWGETTIQAHLSKGARDSLLTGKWDPIAELLEGSAKVEEAFAGLPYIA